jgi:hypothetical protein
MENKIAISFTKVPLPYGWLGNMSPFKIKYNGAQWLGNNIMGEIWMELRKEFMHNKI